MESPSPANQCGPSSERPACRDRFPEPLTVPGFSGHACPILGGRGGPLRGCPRQPRGLSLIELMIVLVVLGVTAAVAVPGFNNLLRNVWTTGRVNEFVSAFNTARSEAITRSNTVTLCASDNPTAASPACGNTWANGWIVFEDDDRDQTLDSAETLIRVWDGLEEGISLTEANGRTAVTYGSRGSVDQAMDFDMEPTNECSGQASRAISVTPVGRTDVQQQACT